MFWQRSKYSHTRNLGLSERPLRVDVVCVVPVMQSNCGAYAGVGWVCYLSLPEMVPYLAVVERKGSTVCESWAVLIGRGGQSQARDLRPECSIRQQKSAMTVVASRGQGCVGG
jgi:hypothetical protein